MPAKLPTSGDRRVRFGTFAYLAGLGIVGLVGGALNVAFGLGAVFVAAAIGTFVGSPAERSAGRALRSALARIAQLERPESSGARMKRVLEDEKARTTASKYYTTLPR